MTPLSPDVVIQALGLSKCYHLYGRPQDRLKQFLFGRHQQFFREFWALNEVSFELRRGEVLGVIGRNGAGKSTLLQLLCGTLAPSAGHLHVKGRVAALLELGAGFNPEFSGRENVFLNAAILGVPREEIEARFEEIVEFSGIRDFLDQPVKTYSSGMFVRLAFSVATSIDPDILIIDEALSVGDGAFARKSFDRIMALKDAGKTILFCSHSTYHIDALCDRALWLEAGKVRMMDTAYATTAAYNTALALEPNSDVTSADQDSGATATFSGATHQNTGRILTVEASGGGSWGREIRLDSRLSTLTVRVDFRIDPELPVPSVALGFENAAGINVSSTISLGNADTVTRDSKGFGHATVMFPNIPLLKGAYYLSAFLACERGVHVYDAAPRCVRLEVSQDDVLQGVVALPHHWVAADD